MTSPLSHPQSVPCLQSTNRGGLCMAPSFQIHPTHGPMCRLHLFHHHRSLNARPNLQVRVNAQDLAALDRLAEAYNLTRADAFRKVLHQLPFPRAKCDADMYLELRKIGVNINQIAKRLNQGDNPDFDVIQEHIHFLDSRLDAIAHTLCQADGGNS